jgi:hypothetical protein
MLTWEDGHFELWQAPVEAAAELGPDEVGESTTFLLMESARRADEAAGVRRSEAAGDGLGELV